MNNCESFGRIANFYWEIIERIILDRMLDEEDFQDYIVNYGEDIAKIEGIPHNICWNCDNCITFVENRKLLYEYLVNGESVDLLIQNRQYTRKARSLDQALRHATKIKVSPAGFKREPYIPNQKKLVYLDHNVIDKFHKDKGTRKRLTLGYSAIQYIYSPAHLEDLIRMKDTEQEEKVINTIQTITNSLFISQYQGNELSLAYEDIKYSLQRVRKWNVAPDIETYREVTTDDRAIFFPERTDENYTRLLTEQKITEHSKVVYILERYKNNISDNENHVKSVDNLRYTINELINTMDLFGYKTDKDYRAVKSGVHDIEHIIYAVGADIFVTYDKKLKCRTEFIYQMLGICTVVMDWKTYAEYVDNLMQSY